MFTDCDHVVTSDGRIHRVVGTLDDTAHFLGYNVYSPVPDGDRVFQGERYRKNFEDTAGADDVFELYRLIHRDDVAEHYDPVTAGRDRRAALESTVWADLYDELAAAVGNNAVGIFGSALMGMHLTEHGTIRKDVDYVIHGDAPSTATILAQRLPAVRSRLGFTTVTAQRQEQQRARYAKLFGHPNNSLSTIIARRWTALQHSPQVVTTVRLRDPAHTMPMSWVAPPTAELADVVVTGTVTNIDRGATFPVTFTLDSQAGPTTVVVFWWKLTTPVRMGDRVSACGAVLPGTNTVRLSHFTRHWLTINTLGETR